MDPFDEFEFKPLTDGLGFHKKAVSLKEGLKNSGVLEDELQGIPASMPRNMLEAEGDESFRPAAAAAPATARFASTS